VNSDSKLTCLKLHGKLLTVAKWKSERRCNQKWLVQRTVSTSLLRGSVSQTAGTHSWHSTWCL